MKSRRVRQILTAALAIGTALLLLPVFMPSSLDRIEEKIERLDHRLRRRLERQGVAFLLDFTRPGGREWISDRAPLLPGVEVSDDGGIPGAQLSGTRWSAIQTPISWRVAPAAHTLLIRIKLLPPTDIQQIMFHAGRPGNTGLKLEGGEIQWHLPGADDQVLSYPFARWGEYVDIAGTVDPATGRAALYENGELKSAGRISKVRFPDQGINFGLTRWYSARHPLHAVLVEAAIWNRPLTGDEIAGLGRRRGSLRAELAPAHLRELRFWKILAGTVRQIIRFRDYLDPRTYARHPELPELRLQLRKRPLREMNRAHFLSRQSGRRTADGARFRNVLAMTGGRPLWGKISLDGSNTRYGSSPRKSFILELPQPFFAGLQYLRLAPPEDAGWLIPLMDTALAETLNLPAVRNGLCRLYLNGRFAGIYYYEDDSRRGVSPQTAEDFLRGPDDPKHWKFPFHQQAATRNPPRGPSRQGLPLPPEKIAELYRELEERIFPLLAGDRAAPFGRRELKRVRDELRAGRDARWSASDLAAPAEQAAAYLRSEMLLNGNPSPDYIRQDLNLEILPRDRLDIRWSSSRPDLISPEGRVRLPEGDLPVEVVLTARVADDRDSAEKSLNFRVMPFVPRIPALMFYLNEPLGKNRRVDLRIERYPEDVFSPVKHRAFQGERAGIKFRGNFSFWQLGYGRGAGRRRKMPFSVRCEEPHRILNETESEHFYLGNGFLDITFMRNRLAYDLYKLMGPGEKFPRLAPDVTWAEIFVNGRYQGLYELTGRVDRHLLGWDRFAPEKADPAVLYKHSRFGQTCYDAVEVEEPPPVYGFLCRPYEQIIDLLEEAPPEEFAGRIGQLVDIASMVDWQLLVNYTGNLDGADRNFYHARNAGAGSPFFILPWDYDHTFVAQPPLWLSNALSRRLRRDYPGYRRMLAERWRELRRGPWSRDSILSRIDRMELRLQGYTRWDYRAWGYRYPGDDGLAQAVSDLRREALNRLDWMDKLLGEKSDEI